MLKYARLLIEIPLNESFPEYIDFISDHGVLVRKRVIYEWKPIKCNHCKMVGHTEAHHTVTSPGNRRE